MLGTGRKIIEDVLLLGEIASLVPLFAKFAATSQIGVNIDAAPIKPGPESQANPRHLIYSVSSGPIQDRRVVSIQWCALSPRDVQWLLGSAFGTPQFTPTFHLAHTHTPR